MSTDAIPGTAMPGRVFADLLPDATKATALVRNAGLVVGGALFTAVLAQIALPLPFTPIPLTLGSFAALLMGAALGPARAMLGASLYVAAGMAGGPVFAGHGHGLAFASFGYALAFVPAAALVGHLARRGHDRSPVKLFGGICGVSLIFYTLGVSWLMALTDADLGTGLTQGVLPFLPGDAIKALAVAGLLPAMWRLINRRR